MIAGGLSPDFGSIYINGNNIVNREKKIFSKIGYMPQYINLDENLNILENEIIKYPDQYFWFHKKWDKKVYNDL